MFKKTVLQIVSLLDTHTLHISILLLALRQKPFHFHQHVHHYLMFVTGKTIISVIIN
jgi:hypothetical protein